GRDPFAGLGSMFGQTRPIQVRAADSSVEVRAQPPGTAQPWLPAESLTLTEQWSPDPSSYRVGEPVTRTVTIRARGLGDEQLPELDITAGIDANAYPDQPQAQTQADGDALVAQKVIKSAIVPTKAGELEIPALDIAWWDVNADQARIAQLPARTIQIAAGAAAPVGAAWRDVVQTQPDRAMKPVPADIAADRSSTGTDPRGIDAGSSTNWWPWLTLGFAIAWIFALRLWWRERSRRRQPDTTEATAGKGADVQQPSKSHLRRQRDAIETACRDNDPRRARQALIAWAETRWPEQRPMRLDLLASLLGEQTQEMLDALDNQLYGQADASWSGTETWMQLEPQIKRAETQAKGEKPADVDLPPLYPSVP
ncbi:MAG: BatD family protein, partial [Gammaproteobacteria bacterium]|nr:BatD family protein [Gammaproteobacteria bacterium]